MSSNTKSVLLDGMWEFKPLSQNFLTLGFMLLNKNKRQEALDKRLCSDETFITYLEDIDLKKWINEKAMNNVEFEWSQNDNNINPGCEFVSKAEFYLDYIPETGIRLVTEDLEISGIYINGCRLEDCQTVRIWDKDNKEYDITKVVRIGYNRLYVAGKAPDWIGPHSIPYFGIAGDFSVDASLKVYEHRDYINAASWSEQGYMNYSGTGIYSREVNLDGGFTRIFLELKTRDVVKLYVNGSLAGIKLWPPYLFDITGYCRKENNLIKIEITNTLSNLFDIPAASGLHEPPRLIVESE